MPTPAGKNFALRRHPSFTPRIKFWLGDESVIDDKVLGKYRVYEGKVTIKAAVRRAKGDTSPLEVSVKLQACDDKQCLLPATIKRTVP